jgi:hypothetical protein
VTPPFLAWCVCGRVHGGWTLGAVERWAAWHRENGCEGCDHVIAIETFASTPSTERTE